MEKSPEYNFSPKENKIKEPESPIKKAKHFIKNISRRLQKPEVSTQPVKKDSNLPPNEINEVAEKIAGKEEVKDFGDFINSKLNEMDRRTFLKFAAGTVASAISVDYVVKNYDKLWAEYQQLNKPEILYGKKISLEDLSKNPELIKEIDQLHNAYTPIDILKAYTTKALEYNDNTLKLDTKVNIGIDNKVQKSIYFGETGGSQESVRNFTKLNNHLKNLNLSLQLEGDGMPLEKFIENKDKISGIIAEDLNIPKEVISKYIEQYLMPDTSRISIVPLDKFKINKDLNSNYNVIVLNNKGKELFKKYDVYNQEGLNYTNKHKALDELEKWGREKGLINPAENLESAMSKGIKSPLGKLEEMGKSENILNMKNFDKFEELFLKKMKESGETIGHLKEIAKDNPEEIIKIISKILDKNIAYDYVEMANILLKINNDSLNKKHEQGIPYITLETGWGVCHDYARTFTAAKYALMINGVPNMDKFVVLSTGSDKLNHEWPILLTIDNNDNLIVTSIDPTWPDVIGHSKDLNAVDKDHYYTAILEKKK